MSRYLLVAFSKPVEGREAEYNDWYDNVHMRDVVNVAGFSSALRFKVQIPMVREMPGHYLAVYEMDAKDPAGVEAALKALASTSMYRSDALDRSGGSFVGIFERIGPGQSVPRAKAGTFRIAGLAQAIPERESEFDAWYEREHMPEVLQVAGMVSGQRYKLHRSLAGEIETKSFVLYEMAANSLEEARETLKAMAAANVGKSTASLPEKTRAAVLEVCSARIEAPKDKALT